MDEMYFDLKKGNYIKIVGDELEIKDSYWDAYNTFYDNAVVRDKIKNFRLLHLGIAMGFSVSIYLMNENRSYFNRKELTVSPKKAKQFEMLKTVMNQHGVFENRSWYDVNHGEYTFYKIQKKLRERDFCEDQKEQELSEEIRLIECPCCKAQISNQAPTCPKCGQPIKVEKPQKMYRINPSGNKEWVHCPKCGSENCSRYREQHYIPGETEVEYTKNLNPLKPFTIANRKEKIIREEKVVTKNRFICNDCGKVFD